MEMDVEVSTGIPLSLVSLNLIQDRCIKNLIISNIFSLHILLFYIQDILE